MFVRKSVRLTVLAAGFVAVTACGSASATGSAPAPQLRAPHRPATAAGQRRPIGECRSRWREVDLLRQSPARLPRLGDGRQVLQRRDGQAGYQGRHAGPDRVGDQRSVRPRPHLAGHRGGLRRPHGRPDHPAGVRLVVRACQERRDVHRHTQHRRRDEDAGLHGRHRLPDAGRPGRGRNREAPRAAERRDHHEPGGRHRRHDHQRVQGGPAVERRGRRDGVRQRRSGEDGRRGRPDADRAPRDQHHLLVGGDGRRRDHHGDQGEGPGREGVRRGQRPDAAGRGRHQGGNDLRHQPAAFLRDGQAGDRQAGAGEQGPAGSGGDRHRDDVRDQGQPRRGARGGGGRSDPSPGGS